MKQSNVYKFDYSWEMQETVCDNRLIEQDYIGALQAAKYSRSADLGKREKKTAQIYLEMQLYDLAALYYFKYLDLCPSTEKNEAYEGLGLCYLNMGEISLAQYYLNMSVLSSKSALSIDTELLEYVRELADEESLNFKIVHPPELCDYSDLLDESKHLLKTREYDKAIKLLSKVPEKSSFYAEAANDMAMAYLLKEDFVNAEKCAKNILLKNPHDITALTSLQSVYLQTQRKAAAMTIAERLYRIKTDDIEDLYKTASVFCEQNMPHKALEKYRMIELEAPYDKDILFTIAALNFNIGNLYSAVRYLRKIYDIYNDTTAKYYLEDTSKILFEKTDISFLPPMPYILKLPAEEKKKMLTKISRILNFKKAEADKYIITSSVKDTFNWCFENDEITDEVLEIMAINALSIILNKNIGYAKELLLSPLIKDNVKFELIGKLCERNFSENIGVVMSGVYKKLEFYPINIARTNRAQFMKAYALCFSKFALIKQNYGEKISDAAEKVYRTLSVNSQTKDLNYKTIAALIYLNSGIKEVGRSVKKIAQLFEANYDKLKDVLTYFKDKQ